MHSGVQAKGGRHDEEMTWAELRNEGVSWAEPHRLDALVHAVANDVDGHLHVVRQSEGRVRRKAEDELEGRRREARILGALGLENFGAERSGNPAQWKKGRWGRVPMRRWLRLGRAIAKVRT